MCNKDTIRNANRRELRPNSAAKIVLRAALAETLLEAELFAIEERTCSLAAGNPSCRLDLRARGMKSGPTATRRSPSVGSALAISATALVTGSPVDHDHAFRLRPEVPTLQ